MRGARHSRRQRRWSWALSARSLSGRRRGRPGRPDRTGGIASRVGASIRLSCRLAPLRARPSGVPRASVTAWRLLPGLPRSVGFGPVSARPFSPARWRFRRHAGAVQRGAAPADLPRPVQALQQHPVQGRPDARRLPVAQPAPARHPRAAARLGRQHLPRDAAPQHGDDAGQRRPVRDRRPAALRLRARGRQQRRDRRPEIIRNEGTGHARHNAPDQVSLVLLCHK